MQDSRNIWIFALLLFVIAFFLGRNSSKPINYAIPTDTSKYDRIIDSLSIDNKKRIDTIQLLKLKFDSLSKFRYVNHKKTSDAIKKIKNFTPIDRIRFRDSVRAANNIK